MNMLRTMFFEIPNWCLGNSSCLIEHTSDILSQCQNVTISTTGQSLWGCQNSTFLRKTSNAEYSQLCIVTKLIVMLTSKRLLDHPRSDLILQQLIACWASQGRSWLHLLYFVYLLVWVLFVCFSSVLHWPPKKQLQFQGLDAYFKRIIQPSVWYVI